MSHWYDQTGKPVYEVSRSDGKGLRDTTLRDARKLKLCYSVTTILQQLDKPQLENWKKEQLLEFIQVHKHLYPIDNLLDKNEKNQNIVLAKSNEFNFKYAKRGTEIHDELERFFKTGVCKKDEDFVMPVVHLLESKPWERDSYISEESFAHNLGYGGKVDLMILTEKGRVIIDFKTKTKDKPLDKSCVYPENLLQLRAYASAYPDVIGLVNIFINTKLPGDVYWHEWPSSEWKRAWQMFHHLLEYKKLSDNFDPSFEISGELNDFKI